MAEFLLLSCTPFRFRHADFRMKLLPTFCSASHPRVYSFMSIEKHPPTPRLQVPEGQTIMVTSACVQACAHTHTSTHTQACIQQQDCGGPASTKCSLPVPSATILSRLFLPSPIKALTPVRDLCAPLQTHRAQLSLPISPSLFFLKGAQSVHVSLMPCFRKVEINTILNLCSFSTSFSPS